VGNSKKNRISAFAFVAGYADCLQREFGQRPVIFYSNGFRTWLWDDVNYAPREVFGFYTKDTLQMMIQRRTTQKVLSQQTINNDITDRPYQHEAIRSVTEVLDNKNREALLIMATGTGKTRTALELVKIRLDKEKINPAHYHYLQIF
jgi:type I restriction enzyme R subunit